MTQTEREGIAYGTPQARGVLLAAVLGSGMAMLDGSIVNLALKSMGQQLGASLEQLQWVTNGYMMALSALILLGGSLGDLVGRRRIFSIGVVLFALASLACGLAPSITVLIVARIVQGVGGALLTPGSLAMIQAAFRPEDRSHAIGTWSSLGAIANLVGPFVGGALVQFATWRWAFFLNVPLAVVTIWSAYRYVPETRSERDARLDAPGAVTASLALVGLTWALIEPGSRLAGPAWGVAAASIVAFLVIEARVRTPMVPLDLFRDRQFSGANLMTFVTYAALGAQSFFLGLQLQVSLGYGALIAGLATLPVTICMIALAGRFGALAGRRGPRAFMTVGPLVCAAGLVLLSFVHAGDSYWLHVLPGILIFGLGLATFVAPLTSTVLASAPDSHAGIASGINNAVARTGSLLAVAALPGIVGLSGTAYTDPAAMTRGFSHALRICAGLLVVGALVSWMTVRPRSSSTQSPSN